MSFQPRALTRSFIKDLHRRLGSIVPVLVKDFRAHKIILFGSWVKGDFSEESDIDLIVIKPSRRNRLERAWEAYRLLSPHKTYPMDVIVLTPQEVRERLRLGDPFLYEVVNHGVVLYEKST